MKNTRTLRKATLAITAIAFFGFGMVGCASGGSANGSSGGTPQLEGNISIYSYMRALGEVIWASYTGTEDGVSIGLNRDGEPFGTAENGTSLSITVQEEGIYTVTVSADGFQSKTSGRIMVVDTSGPAETEGGLNYRKLGNASVVMGGVDPVPKELTIPGTLGGSPVVAIWHGAFSEEGLTSVIIPDSVTSIGAMAFYKNSLKSVAIPDDVTSIEDMAFNENSLTSLDIPGGVTKIGRSAFGDNSLTSVTIPSSVVSIEDYAFASNRLTSVTIRNGVTEIWEGAFSGNSLTAITIPASVTSIGEYAFSRNALTSVTIGANVRISSMGNYERAFRTLYSDNGRLAGTYTYADGNWTRQN